MLSVRFSAIYEGCKALVFPSVLCRSALGLTRPMKSVVLAAKFVLNWFEQKITHLIMKARKCRKEM